MNEIYVMQRANKDLFAFDDHGRFRVPLFRTRRDAMIARSLNFEMLLFKPVALDDPLLQELGATNTGADVDLWLVNDPLSCVKSGRLMEHGQIALLVRGASQPQAISDTEGSFGVSLGKASQSVASLTDTWKDEGLRYSKSA